MLFFFFNDTATTEIYTLSLHDALPISDPVAQVQRPGQWRDVVSRVVQAEERGHVRPRALGDDHAVPVGLETVRSEEHTSELQSRQYLVCRLLLEKKKKM